MRVYQKRILVLLVTAALLAVCLCLPAYADGEAAPAETAAAADEYADMGGFASPERLALAGRMVLEGMGLVFLSLAILWGVLVIFKKIMYDAKLKKQDVPAAQRPTEILPDDDEIPALMPTPADETADDGAVVAAITAAIAAAIASDESLSRQFADGFRVVSFRKKNNGAAWDR
ncbi:MAG: OadG family protein [Clostridia bacterium]|nr:OadG family protein [Clostridia bacterium]